MAPEVRTTSVGASVRFGMDETVAVVPCLSSGLFFFLCGEVTPSLFVSESSTSRNFRGDVSLRLEREQQ